MCCDQWVSAGRRGEGRGRKGEAGGAVMIDDDTVVGDGYDNDSCTTRGSDER